MKKLVLSMCNTFLKFDRALAGLTLISLASLTSCRSTPDGNAPIAATQGEAAAKCAAKFIGDDVGICKPTRMGVGGSTAIPALSCQPFQVNSLTRGGNIASATDDIVFQVGLKSLKGGIYADSNCTQPQDAGTLGKTQDALTLYFKTTTAGAGTITAISAGLETGDYAFTATPASPQFAIEGPLSIPARACSTFTLKALDFLGEPMVVTSDIKANLTSTSGLFYQDSQCSSLSPTATLRANLNSLPIYFMPTNFGNSVLLAKGDYSPGKFETTVTAGAPTQIAIIGPDTVQYGSCKSYALTTKDALSGTTKTPQGINIDLTTLGAGGSFHLDSSCLIPISAASIAMNSSNVPVYFGPNHSGSTTLIATGKNLLSGTLLVKANPPPAPTLTFPNSATIVTSDPNLILSGLCETGNTVQLAGASSQSQICAAGGFTFSLTQASAGSYPLSINQSNPDAGVSAPVSRLWIYNPDASGTAPPSPLISLPSVNPLYSNSSTVSISGSCITGNTVNLGGPASQSTTCSAGVFSFTVTKTTDGTYPFYITQTDPTTHQISPAASLRWIRNTTTPGALTLTSPTKNPYTSGNSSVTITGTCTTGNTVDLGGADTASTQCINSIFNFNSSKSSDGVYTYTLKQIDPSGNSSLQLPFQWNRDTTTPSNLSITLPTGSPYYSNSSQLTIAGICNSGNTVNLSGSDTQSLLCAQSSFQFIVNKTLNATYTFNLTQTNPNNGKISNPMAVTWVRNTIAPSAPTLSTPSSNPFVSGDTTILISGTCAAGSTLSISGALQSSAPCNSTSFSFISTQNVDGQYIYSIVQTDLYGNVSPPLIFQWKRDTTTPTQLSLTNPVLSPYNSNNSSLVLNGTCTTGAVVNLSGSAQQSVTCNNSVFQFNVEKVLDGNYSFYLSQTNPNNNLSSTPISQAWIRNTVAPNPVTLTTPASNPYFSGETSFILSGTCQTGNTVTLAGNSSDTTSCVNSKYSFSITKTTDSIYNFTVAQTDSAGNSSTPVALQWTRDSAPPAAPTIVSPSSFPYSSNLSTLVLNGACVSGYSVQLTGSSSQATQCIDSGYQFTVTKSSDAAYPFSITQTKPSNSLTSQPALFTWHRITAAPSGPVILTPSTQPFVSGDSQLVISGTCQTGTVVALSGSNTGSVNCQGSSFSFTAPQSNDGIYTYLIHQTDVAGNVSPSVPLQWTRDTRVHSSPTIATPSANPYYSNYSSLTISGTCQTGDTVILTGSNNQTTSCASSSYTFNINNSVDGIYSYSVKQQNPVNLLISAAVSQTWTRDTVPPAPIGLTSPLSSPYTSGDTNLLLTGTCQTGATVILSGASSGATVCSNALFSFTISKNTDGIYGFSLAQIDIAGNSSSAVPLQWSRDTSTPTAPQIVVPASSPYQSNRSLLTLSGTCFPGYRVNLSGDDIQSTNCTASGFSFLITKTTDTAYAFNVSQTNPYNGNTSSAATLTWIRNTLLPNPPTLAVPSQNPYRSGDTALTLSGGCLTGAIVTLSGASSSSVLCQSSSFSLITTKTSDGVYNYSLTQADLSGNTSSAVAFQWTRDTAPPSAPTITTPIASPVYSNSSSFIISGACLSDYLVVLGGAAQKSISCNASTYSFTITASSDSTYVFTVKQVSPYNQVASSSVSTTWIRRTAAPAAPVLSSPNSNPYFSGQTNLTLRGTCLLNSTITMTGASSGTDVCDDSTFVIPISQESDGTYSYSITQTDLAGNTSPALSFQWVRDTTVPAAPTISTPSMSPIYSNSSTFVISGSCLTGSTVVLGGADQQTRLCSSSSYTFTINGNNDGSHIYTVSQKNPHNEILSDSVDVEWIRDTTPPSIPVIASPASPYVSGDSSLVISGTCLAGYTIQLSGASSSSIVCTNGLFSLTTTQTSDGVYQYLLTQTDLAGNISASKSFQWTRNTVSPPTPTITTPATNPYYSNNTGLTISGACITGHMVHLVGSDTQAIACNASAYSFTITKTIPSMYVFNIYQTNLANGKNSAFATRTWHLKTLAPPPVHLAYPLTSPFISGDSTLTLMGTCVSGNTVLLSGSNTATATCTYSTFKITVTQSTNGNYFYSLVQEDAAGNLSSPLAFQWTRDSSLYFTPIPTNLVLNTVFTNSSSFLISGPCVAGNIVLLFGDSQQSQTCSSSGTFSFTVTKANDGIYTFEIVQYNLVSEKYSATYTLTWIRDTVIPKIVDVIGPYLSIYRSSNSIEIVGLCTSDNTIFTTGENSQFTTCVNGLFHLSITGNNDGTYTIVVQQKNQAGTIGLPITYVWTKDSSVPSTPTLMSPSQSIEYSKTSPVTLTGICTNGNTVILSGDVIASEVTAPSNSLVQTCSHSIYSFTIVKPLDGTYTFLLKQNNGVHDSGIYAQRWLKDSVAPIVIFDSTPPATNLNKIATFTFHANEASTLTCKLDSGNYQTCTSPLSLSELSQGSHILSISAIDPAGNSSHPVNYTWTQQNANALALYHFDSTPTSTSYLQDSSANTEANQSTLFNINTSSNSSGKFGAARLFQAGNSSYLYSPHNTSQALGREQMSLEAWVKFSPRITDEDTLFSKSGVAGNLGWIFRVKRYNGNVYLAFSGSLDGASSTEIKSTSLTLDNSIYYHVAVTWNRGKVSIYLDGSLIGGGNIGISGQSILYNTNAPLQIGRDHSGHYFDGSMDEFRMSQNVRWSGNFSKPTVPYSAE